MPNSNSAKKRLRQGLKRRARNRRRKDEVKDAIRGFEEALQKGDTATASKSLSTVYKRLDRVAAKGAIHKNAAARRKSRLAKRLQAASAAPS